MFTEIVISKEVEIKLEEVYEEVNNKIKEVRSKSMYYERRKGMEEVFKALGVDVEKLRSLYKVETKNKDRLLIASLKKELEELKAKDDKR